MAKRHGCMEQEEETEKKIDFDILHTMHFKLQYITSVVFSISFITSWTFHFDSILFLFFHETWAAYQYKHASNLQTAKRQLRLENWIAVKKNNRKTGKRDDHKTFYSRCKVAAMPCNGNRRIEWQRNIRSDFMFQVQIAISIKSFQYFWFNTWNESKLHPALVLVIICYMQHEFNKFNATFLCAFCIAPIIKARSKWA